MCGCASCWFWFELLFSAVVAMRLGFGFVLEAELVTQGCFGYFCARFAESKPFLLFTPTEKAAQEVVWGYTAGERRRKWEMLEG